MINQFVNKPDTCILYLSQWDPVYPFTAAMSSPQTEGARPVRQNDGREEQEQNHISSIYRSEISVSGGPPCMITVYYLHRLEWSPSLRNVVKQTNN